MKWNPPDSIATSKSLKDGEKLLIVRIIVQLRHGEHTRIESDRANLAIGAGIRQYSCDRVVRGVSFDNDWRVGLIVCENWRRCEGFLERVERMPAVRREVPWGILSREAREWDHNVRVIIDEAMVEIGEANISKPPLGCAELYRYAYHHRSHRKVPTNKEIHRGVQSVHILLVKTQFQTPYLDRSCTNLYISGHSCTPMQ